MVMLGRLMLLAFRSLVFSFALSGATAGIVSAHDASQAGHGQQTVAATSDPLAHRFGGPFSLIDQAGRPVTEASYRGKYMLVYFGFTHCGDTCPIDLSVMGQALDAIEPALAEKIQPLFISVDPETDTPAILAAYTASFHPKLVGLTGPLQEIERVAKSYHVQRHMILHTATNGHPYFIDHGSLMFLMGPDGRFVSLFPHTTSMDMVANSLRQYVR